MRCHRSTFAFTLLELVLVMVVLSVALAMTVPSLRGWRSGSELRDAADQFVSVTRRARTLAIADARVYRVSVDAGAGTYNLTAQQGESFVATGTTWDRTFTLPPGVRLTFNKTTSTTATPSNGLSTSNSSFTSSGSTGTTASTSTLDFSPTGTSDSATLRFDSDAGGSITVESASPAEGFAIVPNSGGQS